MAVGGQVTPELAEEGLAREVVHRIQNLRRSAQFELTDRITTYYQGPEELGRVIRGHADYIRLETLTEDLVEGPPEDGAQTDTLTIEGMEITLGVKRL